MNECKICKTQIKEETDICNICKYPLKGTEKEQASYIAKQVMQKSDVLESIERLKKSRMILFALGAFYIIAPFTSLMKTNSSFDLIFNIVLGLIFVGFAFLTFKKPKIALAIPLSLTVLFYLILLLINPLYLLTGILWKIIVLIGLGYGYFSVRKSDKILKENEYLASVLGFSEINTNPQKQTDKLENGLNKTLDLITELESKNHSYLADLTKDNIVILQILHGGLMKQTRTKKNNFNYSINLTFDGEPEKQKKFEKLKISKDFKYYEHSSSPCYALNLSKDRIKLTELIIQIMAEVYNYNNNEVFEFYIEEHGPADLAIPN
jgi:Ca2+/Na+ antiporter